MKTTTNLGFNKPEASDYISPDAFNENADKLDEILPQKADLDPDTNKLKAEQFPDAALSGASEKETLADNDSVIIVDSAAGGIKKRVLWSKIRALFASAKHAGQHASTGSDPLPPSAIGALSTDGGTVTGPVTVSHASTPDINLKNTGSSSSTKLRNSAHKTQIMGMQSDANYRALVLNDAAITTSLSNILQLLLVEGGVQKATYNLYHTGNKPTADDVGAAKIVSGSYVGTGTYGADNQTVITCGFKPKLVMIFGDYVDSNRYTGDIGIFWGNSGFLISGGSIYGYNYFTGRNEAGIEFTDTGLSLYSTVSDDKQLNTASKTFDWIAIG